MKNGGLPLRTEHKRKRRRQGRLRMRNHDQNQNGAGAAGRVCSMSVRLSCRGADKLSGGLRCGLGQAWHGTGRLVRQVWVVDGSKCQWRMVVHLVHWSRRPAVVVAVLTFARGVGARANRLRQLGPDTPAERRTRVHRISQGAQQVPMAAN